MPRPPRLVPVARVRPDGEPERDCSGSVAVLTSHGGLTGEVGDPEAAALALHDSIAPVQVLPLLTRGGAERYGLVAEDQALLVGRNEGSDAAAHRLEALLRAAGFSPADLGCAPSAGQDAVRHPAAGAHVALLLAAPLLDSGAESASKGGYLAPDHPLQREILDRLSNFCGIPRRLIAYERDDEGEWTHRAPLRAVTRIYSALSVPFRAALTDPVATVVEELVAAVEARPACLGPVGRRVAEATAGRLLARPAAGGFLGVAARGERSRGIGLWLPEAADEVAASVLRVVLGRMGLLNEGEDVALRAGEAPMVEPLEFHLELREV